MQPRQRVPQDFLVPKLMTGTAAGKGLCSLLRQCLFWLCSVYLCCTLGQQNQRHQGYFCFCKEPSRTPAPSSILLVYRSLSCMDMLIT